MILILHGENYSKSREILLQLRTKLNNPPKIEIDITQAHSSNFAQTLASQDIFFTSPLVVLDISSLGRSNPTEFITAIDSMPSSSNLVILTDKTLTAANAFIKASKGWGAKVVKSDVTASSNIFKFVDNVFNLQRTKAYTEYANLIAESNDPFYLFSMLQFGLRNLVYAKFKAPHFISSANFTTQKAITQSEKFSADSLIELYDTFYTLDMQLKTGLVLSDVVVPYAIEKVISKATS
ncbi:MAG: hypothetical protein R3B92_02330 [Patescibacteria group bacterium]